MSTILPLGIPELESVKPDVDGVEALPAELRTAYNEVAYALSAGIIPPKLATVLLESLPPETLREIIHKTAGLNASLLHTLQRQVYLVDAVLNQMLYPDGRLRPTVPEHVDISVKDALGLSIKMTQIVTRDIPKLIDSERILRLERALGDVMEDMPREYQTKILDRLSEISVDG